MVILLYGPDTFRRNEKLKKLLEDYKKKYPAAIIEKFDLSESKSESGTPEFLRLKEFGLNRSIFIDKKLAVLENVWSEEAAVRGKKTKKESDSGSSSQRKDLKKFFEFYLSDKNFTIIVSERKEPLAAFKFLLEKAALKEEFEELSGSKLKTFIKKEAEALNFSLAPEALDFLVSAYENNIWGLMTELQKLALLPEKEKILNLKKVKEVGDYSGSENLFAFTNSLGYGGDLPRKLVTLERLFFLGEDPAKIFNIAAASRYLSYESLKQMADYDVAVKSGRMDYEEVLVDLVLS